MDRDILRKEMECSKYGRTVERVREELQMLDEYVFGYCGNADIMEAYNAIKNDIGLLSYLDDIVKKKSDNVFFMNDKYSKQERVRDWLQGKGKFPEEIFGPNVAPTEEEIYYLSMELHFAYGGNLENWLETVESGELKESA